MHIDVKRTVLETLVCKFPKSLYSLHLLVIELANKSLGDPTETISSCARHNVLLVASSNISKEHIGDSGHGIDQASEC